MWQDITLDNVVNPVIPLSMLSRNPAMADEKNAVAGSSARNLERTTTNNSERRNYRRSCTRAHARVVTTAVEHATGTLVDATRIKSGSQPRPTGGTEPTTQPHARVRARRARAPNRCAEGMSTIVVAVALRGRDRARDTHALPVTGAETAYPSTPYLIHASRPCAAVV